MPDNPPNTTLVVAPRRKLSAELHALNVRFGHDSVRLGELMEVMGDRAYSLILVLLALPFFTPVSLLGISTAFGSVIALIGFLGLVLRLDPRHLPEKLRNRRLPPRFFGLLLRGAERTIRLSERCTRKRLSCFVAGRWKQQIVGGGVILASLLLMLPLPIPFTNFLPAVTIACLALGLLEEDGGMVLAGFAALLVSVVFFGLLGYYGVEVVSHLHHWLAPTAGD